MIFTELSNQVEALGDFVMAHYPPLRAEFTEMLLQHLEKTLKGYKDRQFRQQHLKIPYVKLMSPNSNILIVEEYVRLLDIIINYNNSQ